MYLALPAMLLALPQEAVEHAPSICVWHKLLGGHCPGCGMTRAILCGLHLQLGRAVEFNRLSVVVVPILGLAWLGRVWRELQRDAE
jgi:hypothetical protein